VFELFNYDSKLIDFSLQSLQVNLEAFLHLCLPSLARARLLVLSLDDGC
jgi:hypothetical protein